MWSKSYWFLVLAAAAACTESIGSEAELRGPIGKADLVGSCEDTSCDGPAPVGNCWCDTDCATYGDCCADRVELCEASTSTFESFKLMQNGFCAPGSDCSSFIELRADGMLRIDDIAIPGQKTRTLTVSAADVAAALPTLSGPALLELLDRSGPPCSQPTDFSEQMVVRIAGVDHHNFTTACTQSALRAARDAVRGLVREYRTPLFDSARLAKNAFCHPSQDCNGFVELRADGTLRADFTGEPGGFVHEMVVEPHVLDRAAAILTDPDLFALLDPAGTPCTQPTDIFESLTVVSEGRQHTDPITFCHTRPIAAARSFLNELATDAFVD
jgi:hypothetical protein